MGNIFKKLFSKNVPQNKEVRYVCLLVPIRIIMLGLDNAGKTTILYTLKLGQDTQMAPTIGYNVETVLYKNIEFNVWVCRFTIHS